MISTTPKYKAVFFNQCDGTHLGTVMALARRGRTGPRSKKREKIAQAKYCSVSS